MSDISRVQGLWIGKHLSKLELLCLHSFLAQGHEFHLYVYDPIDNLPKHPKLTVLDGREILPERTIFKYQSGFGKGSVSGFANWFRYELLEKRGGLYVDLDVVCHRPFTFEDEPYLMGWQDRALINQAVLKVPQSSPLLRELIRLCRAPMRFLPWDTRRERLGKIKRRILYPFDRGRQIWSFGYTGPQALTKFCRHFQMESLIKPVDFFYPVDYRQIESLLDPEAEIEKKLTENTYGIHLFNQMLVRKMAPAVGEEMVFPKGSYLDRLGKRYL